MYSSHFRHKRDISRAIRAGRLMIVEEEEQARGNEESREARDDELQEQEARIRHGMAELTFKAAIAAILYVYL